MATWKLIISRKSGIDKHVDVGSKRKEENRDDFEYG